MTGWHRTSDGTLYFRDRAVGLCAYYVRRAHDFRIETVYQEKSLGEKQPLWRNFFVGRQITNRFGFIDVTRQKAIANEILLRQIGFRGAGITADSPVAEHSGGALKSVG